MFRFVFATHQTTIQFFSRNQCADVVFYVWELGFIQFEPIKANATLKFIDGPKTYLAPSYEDFGWVGIICTNYVIALICFILKYDSRFYKNFLIVALLYSSLTFIFFTNYFFYFSTIVQFIISLIIFSIIQENQLKLDYETN